MEDLEATDDEDDGRGDADDQDMKALGAVREEPVITIGVDGEKSDEGENSEEFHIDDVNGDFLDPEIVREARVEESAAYLTMQVCCRVPVAECGSHQVIKTRWVDETKGTNGLQKFVAGWWPARTFSHPLHLLRRSSF